MLDPWHVWGSRGDEPHDWEDEKRFFRRFFLVFLVVIIFGSMFTLLKGCGYKPKKKTGEKILKVPPWVVR